MFISRTLPISIFSSSVFCLFIYLILFCSLYFSIVLISEYMVDHKICHWNQLFGFTDNSFVYFKIVNKMKKKKCSTFDMVYMLLYVWSASYCKMIHSARQISKPLSVADSSKFVSGNTWLWWSISCNRRKIKWLQAKWQVIITLDSKNNSKSIPISIKFSYNLFVDSWNVLRFETNRNNAVKWNSNGKNSLWNNAECECVCVYEWELEMRK